MQNRTRTTRFPARRLGIFSALLTGLFLVQVQSAAATPLWPDAPVTPAAKFTLGLYAIVFTLGFAALVAYMYALRRAAHSDEQPDSPEPGAKGAFWAGVAVFAVLVASGGLAFGKSNHTQVSTAVVGADAEFFQTTPFERPGLKTPHKVRTHGGPTYSIRVNAQQFLWRYQYTGSSGAWNTYSYQDLVLPAGVTVVMDFTSSDAEASWWVPQFGGAVTAMPGYNNQTWLRADKPGVYTGAGSVVNGSNYATMTTTVHVVPVSMFKKWVDGKQTEIGEAMDALGEERASGVEDELLDGGGKQ